MWECISMNSLIFLVYFVSNYIGVGTLSILLTMHLNSHKGRFYSQQKKLELIQFTLNEL